MRVAGQAKANEKAGRVAAEGLITIHFSGDRQTAAMVETNSETDFVVRDENFVQFAAQVAETACENNVGDVVELQSCQLVGFDESVEERRKALIVKIGENIQVRRVAVMKSSDLIGSYLHDKRIGILVNMRGGDATLAKDIAMHIAANHPIVVSRDEISDDLLAKEKEIFAAQAQESGKPAEIIEKMIQGRLSKYQDEVSLLGQPFVKDPNKKVSQLLKSANAEVLSFTRFEVDEGIEKKQENFAAEVKAQVEASE